jgi:hypothetical protein
MAATRDLVGEGVGGPARGYRKTPSETGGVMLNIGGIGLLARLLGTNPRRLSAVAESDSEYYQDLDLIDPAKPDKRRKPLLPIDDQSRWSRVSFSATPIRFVPIGWAFSQASR